MKNLNHIEKLNECHQKILKGGTNQQMTVVGTNPMYEETGGWQENLVSKSSV